MASLIDMLRGALTANTQQNRTYGGILSRPPYPSEQAFFNSSGVNAYASPDNAAVVSQNVTDPNMLRSLMMNEAARVWMRNNKLQPTFTPTAEQRDLLRGTAYANAPQGDVQQTLAARLLAGDPSAGTPTREQEAFVKRLRYSMGIRP